MHKLLLLFALFAAAILPAQSLSKELGIRFTGLDNYNLLYKKELAPDVYRRFNFAASNLQFIAASESAAVFNVNFSVGIGKEQRRRIGERLVFARGWQPSFGIGLTNANDAVLLTLAPGIGYLLGFNYQVSDRFYFGIEAIPSATLGLTVGEITVLNFRAGFSSGGVGLTGVYRFGDPGGDD